MKIVDGVNAARGEVAVTLAGERARACLTLGALAEIETALGLAEGQALGARLGALKARHVSVMLDALLRGGGTEPEEAARLAARATPQEAAAAVAAALAAAQA